MNSKDIENVLSITELVLRFGVPLVLDVVNTIKEKSPTIGDIHMLKMSINDPESYFPPKEDTPDVVKPEGPLFQ